ncbi:hypothetical protein NX059_007416 [Plenodomus lindquistii]|nr:hypothetical protein NX059_007416 [Plenodomus lindquistii]
MTMSFRPYTSSTVDDFEDLIDWGSGDLYGPIYSTDGTFLDVQGNSFSDGYHIPESIASEQYFTSVPPLLPDGPQSMGYTVSEPPSLLGGYPSFGQTYAASPSFDTTAISPSMEQNSEQYFGSFGASDEMLSPLCHISESPILDTRFAYIPDSSQTPPEAFETTGRDNVFNPHVPGTSKAFSGLDVRVSQVFSNVGGWADQPQIIEPIAESDDYTAETYPIQIPHASSSSHSDTTYTQSQGTYEHLHRSRAVTIPEATRGASSYNHSTSHSRRSQRMAPTLSVSPVAHRLARSCTLSRSTSQSRRKVTTPSPTDSFGWVSYQPNPLTNKLAPRSTDGMSGRTPRGRKKGLTAEQRRHAALMRIVGACTNCQRGKRKCDEGTPCKPCIEHYKGDLVNHPCRDRLLTNLSDAFLSDRLGWHPTARSLQSFTDPSGFSVSTNEIYTIPLLFGFGPALLVPVHPLHLGNDQTLVHDHIVYSWPPDHSPEASHSHAVLPAVVSEAFDLHEALDRHLSQLVTHHFRGFPLYLSPLRILKDIYIFSRTLSSSTVPPVYANTLHQALKLLVLVHIGGDITLSPRPESPNLSQLINNTMNISNDLIPTPCFIRAQFGAIMPDLAQKLMKQVLSSLEQLYLNRDCDDWPLALAITIVVLMTVESIHYHAAKLPYHHHTLPSSSSPPATPPHSSSSSTTEAGLRADDPAIQTLLTFYAACFPGCHSRLRPEWEGEATLRAHQSMTPENTFVQGVRMAIQGASETGYLARKAYEKREEGGMGWYFDRLVGRLLGMRT